MGLNDVFLLDFRESWPKKNSVERLFFLLELTDFGRLMDPEPIRIQTWRKKSIPIRNTATTYTISYYPIFNCVDPDSYPVPTENRFRSTK